MRACVATLPTKNDADSFVQTPRKPTPSILVSPRLAYTPLDGPALLNAATFADSKKLNSETFKSTRSSRDLRNLDQLQPLIFAVEMSETDLLLPTLPTLLPR